MSTGKSPELWNSLVYITSLITITEEIGLLIIDLDIKNISTDIQVRLIQL